ncbi:MAG: hypothetical protein HY070_07890, partial [Chloroflexi bacterium]|nr:hypothetical protein [Chloroflexota bacterium]
LVAKQNPYGGSLRVQVDNDPPRDVELWRADAGNGGRISIARNLDDATHRVNITITRAPVAVNGFVVQRGNNNLVWWLCVSSLVVGGLGIRRLGDWVFSTLRVKCLQKKQRFFGR